MNDTTSPMDRRSALRLASAGALGLGLQASLGSAWAQQSALPPLARIFVGFPPGGAPDIVSRRLAEALTGKLATAVVVENRPGAGGRIALDAARQLPPDGLTLLLTPAGLIATNPHTYAKLNYDPFKDLTPICLTTTVTFGFAVGPAVPPQVRDVASFAAWVRTQPGNVVFGSPAAGAPPHFIGDWLSRSLKLGLTHAAYRGGTPALNDTLGGSIAAICITLGDLVKHPERLRIIGVSGTTRSPYAPNAPTFAEQGINGLDRDDWFGIYVAGNASPEVVQRLSAVTKEAVESAPFQKALRDNFLNPAWSTPQELAQRARADHDHWGPLVKASGFKADS
jgi:tripartite-type tricarboxylate transporter receptor subunit TctC